METITKNNSASMKTVVETYIIEETQELIYDNEKLDQWNSLVKELGLKGQEQVVKTEKPRTVLVDERNNTCRIWRIMSAQGEDERI